MRSILIGLLFPLSLTAADTTPWFDYDSEWALDASFTERVVVDDAPFLDKWANIYALSLALYPEPYINVEISGQIANTYRSSLEFDQIELAATYQWLDDVLDDPVTLNTGALVRAVGNNALHIPLLYHNGTFESVAFVSVGKEWSCGEVWIKRLFGTFLAGIANKGSPWIEALVSYKWNICDTHRIGLFCTGYQSFGNKSLEWKSPFSFLKLWKDVVTFDGYAEYRTTRVFLGADYAYSLKEWGFLEASCSYGVVAVNAPKHVIEAKISWIVPFAL